MNIKKIISVFFPLGVVIFLFYTIVKSWDKIIPYLISADFKFILLSISVLIITYIGGAYLWQTILKSFKVGISFNEALRIFTISNFGRFIPGIILHYAARAYLAKKININMSVSSGSVMLEAYYTFCGAMIMAFFVISDLERNIRFPSPYLYIYFLFLLIILISPNFLFKTFKKVPLIGKKITNLNFSLTYIKHLYFLLFSVSLFFLNGLAFYFLNIAFDKYDYSLFVLTGLFSSSWIVGFLTPVAPGGLGISDLSLAYLLSFKYHFAFASFLVLLYRIGLLLSEVLVLLIVVYKSKLKIWDC